MRALGWKLWRFAGVAVVILGALLGGSLAQASAPRELRLGHAPQRPLDSHPLGRLSATTKLEVLVTLKPQAGLSAYARAVITPGASLYHHFLSVRQFRDEFGATRETIAAVRDSLRDAGLSPEPVSANGLAIAVDASANRFSQAFKTSLERVRMTSGRVAFTNTSAPELAALAIPHVQAIIGLNSLNPPTPTDFVRNRIPQRPPRTRARARTSTSGGPTNSCIGEGTPEAYGWTADEIAGAYGFNGYYATGNEGAGETIGLLELEPNLPSDINAYKACYGLSSTINYMTVAGGVGSGAGIGEAALDIEQVIGLAPQATVDVYQAPNDGTEASFVAGFQAMIDNPSVNIVSDSWTACERASEGPTGNSYASLTSENVLFEQAATEGKSVFAASGDSGSSACYEASDSDDSDDALAVSDPASQPYVTGTGGTSLPSVTDNDELPNPAGQSVWNDGGSVQGGASGGGISNYWPMPAWQSSAAASLNVIGPNSSGAPCRAAAGDYCREVPDVSADGDPQTGYAIYFDGQWGAIGGTSAVAPLWAAYIALVNDSSICNRAPIGFANPLLYEAADNAYASDFTDITSVGNNDDLDSGYTGGLYPVGSGYDMATGLGTPNGEPLGNTLCDEADTVTLAEPDAQTSTIGGAVSLSLTASDSEGHGVGAYSATGLPAGLSINPSTGAITGVPTRSGRYTVGITATASVTGAKTSKSFSWQVVAAATSKATTFKLGNQSLTLTTPIVNTCLAPSTAYKVKFRSLIRSGQPTLKFESVAFYLDKGVKQVRTETRAVNGKKHTVKVTVLGPNATSKHSSSSESLSLKALHSGTHTLKLVITYAKTTQSDGKTVISAVIKTITAKFKVC